MELIGLACIVMAAIISLIYGIILLFRAFEAGILWGLAYLFFPPAQLFFIITHWEEAKSPFLRSLVALPLMFIGIMLSPESFA